MHPKLFVSAHDGLDVQPLASLVTRVSNNMRPAWSMARPRRSNALCSRSSELVSAASSKCFGHAWICLFSSTMACFSVRFADNWFSCSHNSTNSHSADKIGQSSGRTRPPRSLHHECECQADAHAAVSAALHFPGLHHLHPLLAG